MNFPCRCVLLLCLLIIPASAQILIPAVFEDTLPPNGTANETKHLHLPAHVTPTKADILFAIDLTGSMSSALSSVRTNSLAIMEQIRAIIPDTRFGIVTHRDYPGTYNSCGYSGSYGSSGDYPYRRDLALTDNPTLITTTLNSLSVGGGSDGPESYTRVFYETYSDSSLGWRPGSKRFVLFWADNIPHDCNVYLDCGLSSLSTGVDPGRDAEAGTEDDLDLENVLSSMAENNITLIGFQYNSSYHSSSYHSAWQCYAQKTGGNAYKSNEIPSDLASFIADKLKEKIKQIDTLKIKICTPGYENWLESVTPSFVKDILLDTAKDFSFDLTFRVPSTATAGTHYFKVCAIGDGAEYASQDVTIMVPGGTPVINAPDDTVLSEGETLSLTVSASGLDITKSRISALGSPDWLSVDSISAYTATITMSPGCRDSGDYRIHLIATDSTDTAHAYFNVRVNDVNFPPVFDSLPLEQKIDEAVPYELTVRVQDCDGEIPIIRMLTSVAGVTFTDNHNSTGTFSWTPDADDYGYYMYIFEATDGVNDPVRDTIIIEVIDKNVAPPVLTVSTVDTTISVNLPLVIVAHATDADGTVPVLKGLQLPLEAKFTTDTDGNAVFSWTPGDTGIFTFKIIAFDQDDSLSFDSQTVTIRVTNDNITGPKFEPHADVTMQQNENLVLNLRATDPDGTIPTLRLLDAPSGSHLIDNGNGTAIVNWSPACDISGTFLFRATATDGEFHDTIEVQVHVRDVNCTPVFFQTEDVNAIPGERISIRVRAYDPDNNGSIPTLSVYSTLPDYSFVTQDNGSAVFNWTVSYTEGSYPVTFYATDGNSTDSMKVTVSINKAGSLKITAYPAGCRIYAFPSDCYKGKLIGVDSTVYSGAPGTCWFEFQAPGYRSQRAACNIRPDTTTTLSIDLKPAIPLMVLSPDTLKCGSSNLITDNGSISFADLNRDRIPDLSIATAAGIICYYGIDSTDNSLFSPIADTFFSGTLEPSLHHTFIHWNNNVNLSCILSTRTGKILRINLQNATMDTLVSISSSRLYPTIFDANGDGRKDLIVVNAGKGLFVYFNTGSDSVPAIAFAKECTTPDGLSLTGLNGAALLLDTDMDGKEEVIAFSEGKLKLFKPDSTFSTLTYIENLSCGGKLVTADSMSFSLIGSTRGVSSFAIRNGNHILVYPTHLQGDVTFDGKVDIHDISTASRNWEMTPDDQAWDPSINVKLSEDGIEKIDIRDVSRISKSWELQQ